MSFIEIFSVFFFLYSEKIIFSSKPKQRLPAKQDFARERPFVPLNVSEPFKYGMKVSLTRVL